jgi:hypothetical protein
MSERRLTIAQARRVVELLERCEAAIKADDTERAVDILDDINTLDASPALSGAVADLEESLSPDDEDNDEAFCGRCGAECQSCANMPPLKPRDTVAAARAKATAELEAAERAAYIPRKAVSP